MSRPSIAPEVLASFTDAAPSRLIRKLDKSPTMAEGWVWQSEGHSWTVTTDNGERVSLGPSDEGIISGSEQVECTCLLGPRCLHVLATVSLLSVNEQTSSIGNEPESGGRDVSDVEMSEGKREAAASLYRVVSMLLDGGASAAGAVMQAELLRAVHECRSQRLHRAAAAGLRMLRAVRNLRAEKPEFSLEELSMDLHQVLLTAARIRTVEPGLGVDPKWVGTARRAYRSTGAGKKLYGLFTEPIIAGSGYAGVVTYLCDDRGSIFTVSDVIPAEPVRATSAYDAALRLGEATLSHRELSRRGLFLQDATVSADGRLGAGAEVKAVARGASSWSDEDLKRFWDPPIADQLRRARNTLGLPMTDRPAGGDLLFMRGIVVGLSKDGLVVQVRSGEDRPTLALSARVTSDHEVLAYRDNLHQLGRAPGLEILAIGRVRLSLPRTIDMLAIGPVSTSADDEHDVPTLRLPKAWEGRINLGLDKLQGAHLSGGRRDGPELALAADDPVDPVASLRRRLHRFALGGRLTAPPSAIGAMHREAATLEATMMPTAAAMMRGLCEAVTCADRSIRGTRSATDPEQLATAWLRATSYERAATLELHFESWL